MLCFIEFIKLVAKKQYMARQSLTFYGFSSTCFINSFITQALMYDPLFNKLYQESIMACQGQHTEQNYLFLIVYNIQRILHQGSCIIEFIKQVGEKGKKCEACQAFCRFFAMNLINEIKRQYFKNSDSC